MLSTYYSFKNNTKSFASLICLDHMFLVSWNSNQIFAALQTELCWLIIPWQAKVFLVMTEVKF